MKKIELVDDWKDAWRWASTRSMAGTMALLGTWSQLPEDIKAALPPNLVTILAVGWLALGLIGRVMKQPSKKSEKKEGGSANNS